MFNFNISWWIIKSSDRRGRWAIIRFNGRKQNVLFRQHNGAWLRGR